MIYSGLAHLRNGETREWQSFPAEADGRNLIVNFEAEANDHPVTLGLRRIDVKQDLRLMINDRFETSVVNDENDMQEVWELPAEVFVNGQNTLVIEPANDTNDDLYIGEIWLDDRPRQEVLGEVLLSLAATDDAGQDIPCRFTILNSDGALAALQTESSERLAIRNGVVYSASGQATVGLAAGDYTIYCGRGFEYDVDTRYLNAQPGDAPTLEFKLHRAVDTKGLVACDTHVHTFEISRHGDASLRERMITLVGEGIELVAATDHNIFVDYSPYLAEMGLSQHVTPMIGNEVTTKFGHFNIFPAAEDAKLPDHNTDAWEELLSQIYATPNIRVAILNHPRDVHSSFTPFAPENMLAAVGERLDGRQLLANGVELINSAAMQTDPLVIFHDWLTQVSRGLELTAIGASDSHEVSRKIVGQGRSYIYADDSNPGNIDINEAVESLVAGRVLVSLGLLTELRVNDTARSGDTISTGETELEIEIVVRGPQWTEASVCELYANGQLVKSFDVVAEDAEEPGIKARIHTKLAAPKHDSHLVAVARGPGVDALYWPIAKPYQPTSPVWKPYVWGSSGIVRIDADGDGEWTPAKKYAERLVAQANGNLQELVKLLLNCDATIATFAAREWQKSGGSLVTGDVAEVLSSAPKSVQVGFAALKESERASVKARYRNEK